MGDSKVGVPEWAVRWAPCILFTRAHMAARGGAPTVIHVRLSFLLLPVVFLSKDTYTIIEKE